MRQRIVFLLAMTIGSCGSGSAFELSTHALMTNRAYERSVLGTDSAAFARLGIDRWITNPATSSNPFDTRYHEIVDNNGGVVNRVEDPARFEFNRIPGEQLQRSFLKIPGWLMRGAIREDDFPPVVILGITIVASPNPDDAPDSTVSRPLNHFFDPVNNRPLNGAVLDVQIPISNGFPAIKAVDWATGDVDSFASQTIVDTNYRNHFSLRRAREAMWRALTLTYRDNNGNYVDIAPRTELWRKRYWATTFRSLGNAMHLLQDMAQPQHTRNEGHNGLGPVGLQRAATGHASVFEVYLDARANGADSFKIDVGLTDSSVRITPTPLNLDGYSMIPRFNRYSDYWSTRGGFITAKGLADFSNREFFTPANMIGNNAYSLPSPNPGDYLNFIDVAPTTWDGVPLPDPVGRASVRVFTRTVRDALSGETIENSPAFTRSIWDRFMQETSILPKRNLNHVIYNAQADILIPRAVAYSTGLIDYFFRGQLEISLPAKGVYGILDTGPKVALTSTVFARSKRKSKIRHPTLRHRAPRHPFRKA